MTGKVSPLPGAGCFIRENGFSHHRESPLPPPRKVIHSTGEWVPTIVGRTANLLFSPSRQKSKFLSIFVFETFSANQFARKPLVHDNLGPAFAVFRFFMKLPSMNDAQFLELLLKVLPKATTDPRLAAAIYERVAHEVRLINNLKSLEKMCAEVRLPNLEPETVAELQGRLSTNFGEANVILTPTEKGDSVGVEIILPDRTVTNRVKVLPPGTEEVEEVKVPYVPFPVVLPEDVELVWVLARREDLPPEEATRSLACIEEEFWETKAGQKLLRDRVEKSFFEFISRVPAAALAERGLKRLFKMPEPLHTLRRLGSQSQAELKELD